MSTEKMREEFEAWIGQYGYSLERDSEAGGYYADSADLAWSAWQDSRAALEVELPETSLTGSIGVAHKAVTNRCREAIEAAGVRVKA